MFRVFLYVGEFLLATYFVLDVVVPVVRRQRLFPMARSTIRKVRNASK